MPTNTIIINSYHIPNGMPGYEDDAAINNGGLLLELLATIHHEGTHYKEGGRGWFNTRFSSGYHSTLEGNSQKFANKHIREFLRTYYGL